MTETKKILLGLTTTFRSDWKDKIQEIRELNLKEIALFPTVLKIDERKELYRMISEAGIETIPYVHLREDFSQEEVEFLMDTFKTKIFSCHSDVKSFSLMDSLAKYASLIYVENPQKIKSEEFFNAGSFSRQQVIGICLDNAHLENLKNHDRVNFRRVQEMLKIFPIGVNHISGFKFNKPLGFINLTHPTHYIDDLKDFDYLRGMPAEYFSKCIALEVENSLAEQIEMEKYLKLILKNEL